MRLHPVFYYAVILVVLLQVFEVLGNDLFVGYDYGSRMSYQEVKKHGFLFFKRAETLFFKYPDGKITGIACVDLTPDKTGNATITKGGLDHDFVEIYLESERSTGLRYIVEIYTSTFKL